MPLHVIRHPLIAHKLGFLRQSDLDTRTFRELTREISSLLAYEASRQWATETVTINSWGGATQVQRLGGLKLTVVPILRAGVGMLDGVLSLLPSAKVSVVGLYRNEQTLEPVVYFQKLASHIDQRLALMIDPMLATGGTLVATIDLLKQAGCHNIHCLTLVAAPEGVERVLNAHKDVHIYTASLDEKLNDQGYILPGLGDAGDRLFGTQ